MGGSKSSSKADQTSQTSGDADASSGIGAEGNTSAALQNVVGDVELRIEQDGVKGSEVVDLGEVIFEHVDTISGRADAQLARSSETIQAIAASNTGAESEAGRLVNKYAVPGLLALLVLAWMNRGKR